MSDILPKDQTTLNKIDIGDIDRGIYKITDIDWQSRSTMNRRNLGDDQGEGIISITVGAHHLGTNIGIRGIAKGLILCVWAKTVSTGAEITKG